MKHIVVSGDVMVDHHLYEGERHTPTMNKKRGVREKVQHGGAASIVDLLKELYEPPTADEASKQSKPQEPEYKVSIGVTMPDKHGSVCSHHAFAVWRPFEKKPAGKKNDAKSDPQPKHAWRANLVMGYGHDDRTVGPEPCVPPHEMKPVEVVPPPTILILDDAGYELRKSEHESCWQLPKPDGHVPEWIILKMSAPVAQGDLFTRLERDFADRVVCIVSAQELRQECVALSQSLSWERTVEDLIDCLLDNPTLAHLMSFRHLIVTFGSDGAVWIDFAKGGQPTVWLVCDAGGAEGEFAADIKGTAFGYHSLVVAAVARCLVAGLEQKSKQPPPLALDDALASSLTAMRDLLESGHGDVGDVAPTGFPVKRLVQALSLPNGAFARIPVAWPSTSNKPQRTWRIVESTQSKIGSMSRPSLLGLARQVVLHGTRVLRQFPHAKFGDLFTADRLEIEALRSIRKQMRDFRDDPKPKRPLSIGVFGPPGAGKSFGVKELTKAVFGEASWLEFNLSQFGDSADLIGALHQVRDRVLSGITPVVFWDEFDSKEFNWLQYLLAPMQDGRFQEKQLNHSVGKCVFVFAGGTSHSFEDFGPRDTDTEAYRTWQLRKGPDFSSRLDAYYDVLGPNQRVIRGTGKKKALTNKLDPNDVCYPLRRAIVIRSKLNCLPDETLDCDSDLIDALLAVPVYKHGTRSLEKLVTGLRVDGGPIRRSALPPPNRLHMHVDCTEFEKYLTRFQSYRRVEVEQIAAVIHSEWRKRMQDKHEEVPPRFDMEYAKLGAVEKEENQASARRIPEVLALVGLCLEPLSHPMSQSAARAAEVREHLVYHLELLAEAEHNGWMAHREKNGWRYSKKRNDALKLHDCLIPYADLPHANKDKDRNAILSYPDLVRLADYRIVFMKSS